MVCMISGFRAQGPVLEQFCSLEEAGACALQKFQTLGASLGWTNLEQPSNLTPQI